MSYRLAGLILAAGESRRFGRCKQALQLAGKPLLAHVLDASRQVFATDLYCVTGAWREQVEAIAAGKASLIHNPSWQMGMGTSIAAGVQAIHQFGCFDGVLICLGDQYLLKADDFRHMLTLFTPEQIVATDYQTHAGVPALFPKRWFAGLEQLQGDQGARQLLKSETGILITEIPNANHDIDIQEDLKFAQARLNS